MVNNVLLFYFEVFGSYYQLYKLANNRDKLVNTFCVIHEIGALTLWNVQRVFIMSSPALTFPAWFLSAYFTPSIRQMQSGSFSPFTSVCTS